MKTKTKKIFFFFTFLILIQCISVLILPVNAQTTNLDILNDNFQISVNPVGTFNGGTTEIGGKHLSNFQNLGMISSNDETIILFKAKITLDFAINYYTTYDLTNTFSFATERTNTLTYLRLQSSKEFNVYWEPVTTNILNFTYKDYRLGNIVASGFSNQFDIKVDYIDFDSIALSAQGYDVNDFNINDVYLQTNVLNLISSQSDVLDKYTDIIVDKSTNTTVSVIDMTKDAVPTLTDNEPYLDINEVLNQKIVDTGVGASIVPNSLRTVPIQQSVAPISSGTEMYSIGSNTFRTLTITNKPEVLVYRDNIRRSIESSLIQVDTNTYTPIDIYYHAGIFYSNVITTTIYDRTIGYRVNNFNIQNKYSTTMYLYSSVQVASVEDKEILLGIPEFVKGDMIWDQSLYGDSASLVFTETPNWLTGLFNFFNSLVGEIILIGVGIVVVIVLYKFGGPIANGVGNLAKKGFEKIGSRK